MRQLASLAVFVVLVATAATFGSMFRPGVWYATLAKPAWTPPSWAFPVAWTALYIMIAVAGWLAWRAEGLGRSVTLWGAGLAANALWSYLFFGLHQIGWALADITLMLTLIVAFIVSTWTKARTAALLFLPYLAWVSFAGALNATIWAMNP